MKSMIRKSAEQLSSLTVTFQHFPSRNRTPPTQCDTLHTYEFIYLFIT